MRRTLRLAALALASLVLASLASVTAARAADEVRVTPYLWYAGLEGTVGSGSGDPDGADADFGDFQDNMRIAGGMVNVSWRHDRWTAFGDWTYAKVKSDTPTRLPALYSTAEAVVRGNILQAYAGYDVMPSADGHLDLFAGARYYDVDLTLDLEGAAAASRSANADGHWLDGVIGARLVRRFGDRWEGYLLGDVGAGGSAPSWQLIASVGYHYDWGTLLGGWRYLRSDYRAESLEFDAALTGPFLGASFSFQ